MSDWKERTNEELNELRRIRDELRVRVHLGKKDAQSMWEHLERRMSELEEHARRAVHRTEAPRHELAEASRHLVEELRNGYRDLRKHL